MTRGWFFALVISSAAASHAAAQEAVRLIGEVRDVATEQPLGSVVVRIVELGRADITDRNGFFSFDSIPPGVWTFEASAYGYETNVEASEIRARNILLIRLAASPVAIEGLFVSVVQRLQRRRMAAPSRVFAWDMRELRDVVSPDVSAFLRRRGVARFQACGGEFSELDLPNCIIHRGRLKRLRLFVDDIEVVRAEGVGRLWAYDPTTLWSLEFVPDCDPPEIRIYTGWFMEQVESGRIRLNPLICTP